MSLEEIYKIVNDFKEEQRLRWLSNDNTIEDLFYVLLSERVDKKSIQEVVELAIIEHFDVNRIDFHRVKMGKYGDAESIPDNIRRVAHARKWHVSILMNMLHVSNFTMKSNYGNWYHHRIAFDHRPAYMGALMPCSVEDQSNRDHLLSIGNIIKRMCNEEGLLDERLDLI